LNYTKIDKDIKRIIELYELGTGIQELADIFHYSRKTIKKKFLELNIKIRSRGNSIRKHKIFNENYFETVDTEEKAYFLGLLFSDGTNQITPRNRVRIQLVEQDSYILEKLSNIFYQKVVLYTSDKNFRKNYKHQVAKSFEIMSRKISEDLYAYGMVQAKSLILEFPKRLDSNLYRYFIKGMTDGDGHIALYKKKKYFNWGLIGTYDICINIQKIIKNDLNINTHMRKRNKNNDKNTYTLSIGGNVQLEKFLDWMYKNSSIHLIRKYNKYLELKNINKLRHG
jgi:hypothetical protein